MASEQQNECTSTLWRESQGSGDDFELADLIGYRLPRGGNGSSIRHRHLKLLQLSIWHFERLGADGFVCEANDVSAIHHTAAEALAHLGE
jgi:hypothetical protein